MDKPLFNADKTSSESHPFYFRNLLHVQDEEEREFLRERLELVRAICVGDGILLDKLTCKRVEFESNWNTLFKLEELRSQIRLSQLFPCKDEKSISASIDGTSSLKLQGTTSSSYICGLSHWRSISEYLAQSRRQAKLISSTHRFGLRGYILPSDDDTYSHSMANSPQSEAEESSIIIHSPLESRDMPRNTALLSGRKTDETHRKDDILIMHCRSCGEDVVGTKLILDELAMSLGGATLLNQTQSPLSQEVQSVTAYDSNTSHTQANLSAYSIAEEVTDPMNFSTASGGSVNRSMRSTTSEVAESLLVPRGRSALDSTQRASTDDPNTLASHMLPTTEGQLKPTSRSVLDGRAKRTDDSQFTTPPLQRRGTDYRQEEELTGSEYLAPAVNDNASDYRSPDDSTRMTSMQRSENVSTMSDKHPRNSQLVLGRSLVTDFPHRTPLRSHEYSGRTNMLSSNSPMLSSSNPNSHNISDQIYSESSFAFLNSSFGTDNVSHVLESPATASHVVNQGSLCTPGQGQSSTSRDPTAAEFNDLELSPIPLHNSKREWIFLDGVEMQEDPLHPEDKHVSMEQFMHSTKTAGSTEVMRSSLLNPPSQVSPDVALLALDNRPANLRQRLFGSQPSYPHATLGSIEESADVQMVLQTRNTAISIKCPAETAAGHKRDWESFSSEQLQKRVPEVLRNEQSSVNLSELDAENIDALAMAALASATETEANNDQEDFPFAQDTQDASFEHTSIIVDINKDLDAPASTTSPIASCPKEDRVVLSPIGPLYNPIFVHANDERRGKAERTVSTFLLDDGLLKEGEDLPIVHKHFRNIPPESKVNINLLSLFNSADAENSTRSGGGESNVDGGQHVNQIVPNNRPTKDVVAEYFEEQERKRRKQVRIDMLKDQSRLSMEQEQFLLKKGIIQSTQDIQKVAMMRVSVLHSMSSSNIPVMSPPTRKDPSISITKPMRRSISSRHSKLLAFANLSSTAQNLQSDGALQGDNLVNLRVSFPSIPSEVLSMLPQSPIPEKFLVSPPGPHVAQPNSVVTENTATSTSTSITVGKGMNESQRSSALNRTSASIPLRYQQASTRNMQPLSKKPSKHDTRRALLDSVQDPSLYFDSPRQTSKNSTILRPAPSKQVALPTKYRPVSTLRPARSVTAAVDLLLCTKRRLEAVEIVAQALSKGAAVVLPPYAERVASLQLHHFQKVGRVSDAILLLSYPPTLEKHSNKDPLQSFDDMDQLKEIHDTPLDTLMQTSSSSNSYSRSRSNSVTPPSYSLATSNNIPLRYVLRYLSDPASTSGANIEQDLSSPFVAQTPKTLLAETPGTIRSHRHSIQQSKGDSDFSHPRSRRLSRFQGADVPIRSLFRELEEIEVDHSTDNAPLDVDSSAVVGSHNKANAASDTSSPKQSITSSGLVEKTTSPQFGDHANIMVQSPSRGEVSPEYSRFYLQLRPFISGLVRAPGILFFVEGEYLWLDISTGFKYHHLLLAKYNLLRLPLIYIQNVLNHHQRDFSEQTKPAPNAVLNYQMADPKIDHLGTKTPQHSWRHTFQDALSNNRTTSADNLSDKKAISALGASDSSPSLLYSLGAAYQELLQEYRSIKSQLVRIK